MTTKKTRPGTSSIKSAVAIKKPRTSKKTAAKAAPPPRAPSRGPTHYLGLDQSSSYTGLAWLSMAGPTPMVYTTTFEARGSGNLVRRLVHIESFVRTLACDGPASPNLVFTEQVFPGRRSAYGTLLRVEAVIHMQLYKSKVPYETVGAAEWSRLLGLRGTKSHARDKFHRRLGGTPTEHEFDALGVLFGGLIKARIITVEWIGNPKLKFTQIPNPDEFTTVVHSLL